MCLALDVQHYLAFELVLGLINTGSEPRTEDFTVQVTVGSGEDIARGRNRGCLSRWWFGNVTFGPLAQTKQHLAFHHPRRWHQ